ncbi:MAG TPA: dUTP diphosphatase [Marinagarivorans sp.]
MQQQIVKMLEMQDAMNTKVNANWRAAQFEWYRAIWIECAELMDHYGWKWWKKQSPDMEQVNLELVDIWHFGLSDMLQRAEQVDTLADSLNAELSKVPSVVAEFRIELEAFVADVLASKAFNLAAFCRVLAAADLSFEQLYLQYTGKNVLNFFRQDHGYQDGSYRKLWQGKEDNEHLVEVLETLEASSTSFQTDIYAALKARYVVD